MNRKIKFHSPDGPAFLPGEQWLTTARDARVSIASTRRYGPDKWDVEVEYVLIDREDHHYFKKDAWNFQVRYFHIADLHV